MTSKIPLKNLTFFSLSALVTMSELVNLLASSGGRVYSIINKVVINPFRDKIKL